MAPPVPEDSPLLGSRIAPVLERAVALLRELPDSPHARELRAQARTYERLVAKWATVPPSQAQLDALLDLVVELQEKATAASHSVPSTSRPIR